MICNEYVFWGDLTYIHPIHIIMNSQTSSTFLTTMVIQVEIFSFEHSSWLVGAISVAQLNPCVMVSMWNWLHG